MKRMNPLELLFMKNIQNFDITHLPVDENFGFHQRILALAETHLTRESDAPLVAAYKSVVTPYDEALKQDIRNSFTPQVMEADAAVDARYLGSRHAAIALTYHPDPDKAEAGKRIWEIYRKYGNPTRLNYTKQYAILHNLLQELAELGEDLLALTGFDEWRVALLAACERFNTLRALQVKEDSLRSKGIVRRCRIAADTAYRTFVLQVNALSTIGGEAQYGAFIDQANVIIDGIRALQRTRATKAGNGGEEEAAPTT